jgi:hypothetical protein
LGTFIEEPTGVCLERGFWTTASDGNVLLCIPSPGACDACGSGNVALRMTREQRRAYEDLVRMFRRHPSATPKKGPAD